MSAVFDRLDFVNGHVDLAMGSGGRASALLIEQLFYPAFDNPILRQGNDQAVVLGGTARSGGGRAQGTNNTGAAKAITTTHRRNTRAPNKQTSHDNYNQARVNGLFSFIKNCFYFVSV